MSGCPSIVSTGGSLPEIQTERLPILGTDDVTGWAEMIRLLLDDQDERDRLADIATTRARDFRPELTTDRLLDLFLELGY